MHKLNVIILILAVLVLLPSCSPGNTTPEAPAADSPTESAAMVEPTVEEPTAVPDPTEAPTAVPDPTVTTEPTATALPTEEPAPEPEPTEEPVAELVMDNCQTCHNSQEMLTQTADPALEEAEASESSGVG